MADRTPTPWTMWCSTPNSPIEIRGSNGGAVSPAWKYRQDALRAVVSVNACADISTEALESGAVARLVECQEALNWLVHLAHDVGKDGGRPHPDEWEAAFEAGKKALAALEPDKEAT